MGADSQGGLVWGITRDLFPGLRKVEPTLVHLDYSPGNVLWAEGRISAIVDWEEAAYGDPGIEVAYCRMQMYLKGTGSVAAEFLDARRRKQASGSPTWALGVGRVCETHVQP
jgi:aminoglycoside phosphotransferase (APT) family kinase protein